MSPMLDNNPAVSEFRDKRIARATIVITIIVMVLLGVLLTVMVVEAESNFSLCKQDQFHWSTPKQIPNYYDPLRSPYLVADRQGSVHAFNIESPDALIFTLMYRQWTINNGWTSPVDILLIDHLGTAPILRGVFLDDAGVIHLVFVGGSQEGSSVFYTWAHTSEADNTSAWAEPVLVGAESDRALAATIGGDGKGKLIIVFGSEYFGAGLYEVHTMDGGKNWSQPVLLSRSRTVDVQTGSIELDTDEEGSVHIVWYTLDSNGNGLEIRYGRLKPSYTNWENEAVVASLDQPLDMVGWPSIISSGKELILVYQDGFPPTRWVLWSYDAGETWSNPVRPFPHRGGYEVSVVVKDSLETVHMVLGNRLPNPEIHGMWYSQLVGDRWLPLEPIVSGPVTDTFDPCCPRAVISQGNVLLATWPHNVSEENLTGAWYSYTLLDVPELPILQLPEPLEPTVTPGVGEYLNAVRRPTNTPLVEIEDSLSEDTDRGVINVANPVFLGTIPIFVALGAAVVYRIYSRGGSWTKASRAFDENDTSSEED